MLIRKSKKSITDIENNLRLSITQGSAFTPLSFLEQELIIAFYIRRGNVTNKELGVILNSSESQIKGRMYSIFQKLEAVTTRTALLAFIEDNI